MPTMNQAVLTQQGIELMNEAGSGINTIQFTKAVTSSDDRYPNLTPDQLVTLTDLDNVQQTVKPGAPYPAFTFNDSSGNQQYTEEQVAGAVKSKSATTVPIVFPNKGKDVNGVDYQVNTDYLIQAIGLYAHDGNRNQDILYLVMTASTPHLMTAYDGNTSSFKVKEITAVGRTDKLNVVVNDFDSVTVQQLATELQDYVSAVKPQNLSNDFNFSGKLQHNGIDVVDQNQLKNQDNTDHNFTGNITLNGQNVATKTNVGDAYNQAVNDTENYVKNNSIIVDNTISGLFSYGGNRLISLGGTPSTHDFNTMTTTGFFVSNDTVNHYANGPTYLQDGNRQFSLIVTDTGTDIYQQLMMAGNPPMYRMLQWGVWTNWQRLLFMERIPVPATITGDAYGTANAISAFYDVSQQNIYLNGFIDVNMPNFCTLNLDVSNIRAYISMPNINVVGSSFNGLDGGINTPTKGLVDNTNKIAISFKNKQRYSLEASVINLNIQ